MTALVPHIALGFALLMLANPVKAEESPHPARRLLPAGALARLRTSGRVTTVALSHDGGDAFTAAEEGAIHRWDALSGLERRHYLGHKAEVVGLLLSPDGRTLFSQSKDNTLRAWDVASGVQRWRRDGLGGYGCRLALSPDGKMLAIVERAGALKLFEAATGEHLHDLAARSGGEIRGVAFAPDASAVFALTSAWHVRRWETATGRSLPDLMLPANLIKVYT